MDRQAEADGRLSPRNLATALLLLGVVALLGIGAGFASQQATPRAVGATPTAADADRSTLPATVPLRSAGGHLFVDVSFGEGLSTVRMLLDTGAPTIIPSRLAAQLGATPFGQVRLVPLGAAPRDVPIVRIPEVRIGRARFTDVAALVAEPEPGGALADLAGSGIVGTSLVAAAVWQLDYPARQLTIAADAMGLADVDGAAALRVTPDALSPVVDLHIDGATVPTLIDTGSDAGLVAHPDALPVAHGSATPRTAVLDGWDGRQHVVSWSACAEVAIGPGPPQRRYLRVTTALPPGTAIAGNAFLFGHVLTIDLQSGLVHLLPNLSHTPPQRRPGRSGSWMTGSTSACQE